LPSVYHFAFEKGVPFLRSALRFAALHDIIGIPALHLALDIFKYLGIRPPDLVLTPHAQRTPALDFILKAGVAHAVPLRLPDFFLRLVPAEPLDLAGPTEITPFLLTHTRRVLLTTLQRPRLIGFLVAPAVTDPDLVRHTCVPFLAVAHLFLATERVFLVTFLVLAFAIVLFL